MEQKIQNSKENFYLDFKLALKFRSLKILKHLLIGPIEKTMLNKLIQESLRLNNRTIDLLYQKALNIQLDVKMNYSLLRYVISENLDLEVSSQEASSFQRELDNKSLLKLW